MGIYPHQEYKFIRIKELINRFKCISEFYSKEVYECTYDMPIGYDLKVEQKEKCKLYNLPYFGYEDNMALYDYPIKGSQLYYGCYALELNEEILSLQKRVFKLILGSNRKMITL